LGSTWELVKAMMNVSDDEEAIAKIADAFSTVGLVIDDVNKLLEKTLKLVNALHLGEILGATAQVADLTVFGGYFGRTLHEAATTNAHDRTNWTPTKDPVKAAVENAKATDTSTSAIEEAIKKKKEEIRTIAQATLIEIGYTSTTKETDKSIGKLGNVAASAVSHINSALSSGGGGGGGGGGCSTCGTRSSSSGSCASGSCSGSSSYDPSGIGVWQNVVGNQYAGMINAMGEDFARSITQVNNSCRTGDMTSFVTGSGDKAHTYVNTGNGIVQVNDALITNKGEVIQFHPDDNILAFKGNGPKGSTNVTINVNGAGDPERVAELILKKINTKVGMAW
jgi:hypothetical protein